MTSRVIKSHPKLANRKTNLVERDLYAKELEKLTNALKPLEQLRKTIELSNQANDQLKKITEPSLKATEELRKTLLSNDKLIKNFENLSEPGNRFKAAVEKINKSVDPTNNALEELRKSLLANHQELIYKNIANPINSNYQLISDDLKKLANTIENLDKDYRKELDRALKLYKLFNKNDE